MIASTLALSGCSSPTKVLSATPPSVPISRIAVFVGDPDQERRQVMEALLKFAIQDATAAKVLSPADIASTDSRDAVSKARAVRDAKCDALLIVIPFDDAADEISYSGSSNPADLLANGIAFAELAEPQRGFFKTTSAYVLLTDLRDTSCELQFFYKVSPCSTTLANVENLVHGCVGELSRPGYLATSGGRSAR